MPDLLNLHDRCVHNLYGRGRVLAMYRLGGQARVQFDSDGDIPRLVMLRDVVREPAGMPMCASSERAVPA